MTVPPPVQPPPLPRILDDVWEPPRPNRPSRLRVVVVAASIGTALIMASVAILKSSERTQPGDESAWARPAPPPPYAITRDTTPLLSHGETPALNEASAPPKPPPPPPPPPPRRRPTQRFVRLPLPGYLSINSNPWAELSVDGRVVGSTPQIRVRVTPGRHHLLLVREGFKTQSAWVDVVAGGTVRITNITLEKDAQ